MPEYESAHGGNHASPKCRTCTDFKSWSKQQRELFSTGRRTTNTENGHSPTSAECPLDKNELGRNTWSLLHTIGATYPDQPTAEQKTDMKKFFDILSKIYPCEYCARDLRTELKNQPVDTSSQFAFSLWLCKLHNTVNKKLGKPIYDCSKINERWRDGWADGSCD